MQDWQHASMYSAFMVSGLVDLIGFYLPGLLPPGTEHVRIPLLLGLTNKYHSMPMVSMVTDSASVSCGLVGLACIYQLVQWQQHAADAEIA